MTLHSLLLCMLWATDMEPQASGDDMASRRGIVVIRCVYPNDCMAEAQTYFEANLRTDNRLQPAA